MLAMVLYSIYGDFEDQSNYAISRKTFYEGRRCYFDCLVRNHMIIL